MKVILIEPRASEANVYSKLHMPLLGPVYLGTILSMRGHEVEIYNENIQAPDYAELKADLVGISVLTPTAKRGYEIAGSFPREKVIMGGVHASLLPEEALGYARQVVVGEAEEVILDIVEGRRTEAVVQGGHVKDLDSLPYPDFSLIKGYRSPPRITPISTSRGCPFDCVFCSVTKMFGREYRFRSAENILKEMSSRDTKQFFICDDNFAAKPKRTRALLGLMAKNRVKPWACQVRCDVAKDKELLDLMGPAGCRVVCVGFESVNPRTLEAFHKGQTVSEIAAAIRSFHEKKIKIHGMFVLGGEDDNKNTVWETLKFAVKHKIDTLQMTILTPFPGTKVYEDLEAQKRIFSKDWSLYDCQHSVFRPKQLSAMELETNVVGAYEKFYSVYKAIELFLRLSFRNSVLRFMGYSIVKEWIRLNKRKGYIYPALFLLSLICAGCAGTNKMTAVRTGVEEYVFPKDFMWGAGTSSHQVEGNNTNNDWWRWEQHLEPKMRSGQACDEWERFEEDFKRAQTIGLTAYRFSLEWSRIEPSPGQFDDRALRRYHEMILSLRAKGIEPIVTLNHYTIPVWFADEGGWVSDKGPELFARYAAKVTEAMNGDVHYWITLNEPAVYMYKGYMIGQWPPGEKSTEKAFTVIQNLAVAHVLAYGKTKEVYAREGWKEPMIGVAQQVLIFAPCSSISLWDRVSSGLRDRMINHLFIRSLIRGKGGVLGIFSMKLPKAGTLDFIGLNYYTREYVTNRGFLLPDILGSECNGGNPDIGRNSLGWEIYPEGLYILIKAFSKYKLPILVSENGICTDDDTERSAFIRDHLGAVARAMKEGAPVIGYLYWSLLDNYEWADGYAPRFGLIGVDLKTQERTVRGSAGKYGEIIRAGKLII
ncbi:MAG: family 1 glycosylhydrolase [Candidatus Omnitrophica bacterium]|nr:family 1 glycosylhydrolase [Candidatus Omnitrophota bacterium]